MTSTLRTGSQLFSRTKQPVQLHRDYHPFELGFLEGVAGGECQIDYQGGSIRVDLMECCIEETTLAQRRQPM